MSAVATVSGGFPVESEGSQEDPLVRRIVKGLLNGSGAKLTQVMVVVGFPVVSGLAMWGYNLSVENQNIQLRAINEKLDDALRQYRSLEPRMNSLENSVGRIEEHQSSTDARLSRLEQKAR